MSQKLTNSLIEKMNPRSKRYEVSDAILPNFYVRVYPSGKKVFYARLSKNNGYKIGDCAILTAIQAREIARDLFAKEAQGIDPTKPLHEQSIEGFPADHMTLLEYLDTYYSPWVKQHRRTGRETMNIINARFASLMNKKVLDITKFDLMQIRTELMDKKMKRASINRGETALKAALNWGVKEAEKLSRNPLNSLSKLKEDDSEPIVRYLSEDERARLFNVLDKHYATSQLRYAVVVSLNTGIRRGALRALDWADVDFSTQTITLKAAHAKSMKTQQIPMNTACAETLLVWREIQGKKDNGAVFPEDNSRRSWETAIKKANIKNFRWHDMRHDFASQLVMRGVDLNTVRELLGHSDIKMTMRYAHLAPEAKRQAVDLLDIKSRRKKPGIKAKIKKG